MSTYDINKIQLPNGDVCNLKDADAVTNTDYATSQTGGVVKVGSGLQISSGELSTNPATLANIKSMGSSYKPIVPSHQHESTFYGLTKAAGIDMASSDNAVGIYTDEAKGAIQNMLGINSMLAPIQTNTLAIQAYSINDLFWYNGKLYKATAAIAQNGNIVVGTNCVETKLTDILVKNTDTIPVNQGGTGNTSFTADYVLVGNGTNAIAQKGLKITGAINNNVILESDSGKTISLKTNTTMYFDSGASASHVFRKDTTEFARFNVNGKLQLGGYTGTQNTHDLYVNGDSAFNGKITFGTTSGNNIVEKAYMQYNTTDNSIDFIFV